MAETYTGGCHCGAVRFTATLGLDPVLECNCSHCSKKGLLLAFTPRENFTLDQGEGGLTEYRFNRHHIGHQFCKVCGVQPFAFAKDPKGVDTAAINVRCLDGVDLAAVKRTPYDGASA